MCILDSCLSSFPELKKKMMLMVKDMNEVETNQSTYFFYTQFVARRFREKKAKDILLFP